MSQRVKVAAGRSFVEWPAGELERSIPSRFEDMARRYPERPAVVSASRTFSYHVLNTSANRLARAILAQQGEGEEPVAFLLEHGPGAILAILAVLKAGKFYLALDPTYPPARLAGILADSQTGLIITNCLNLALAEEIVPDGSHVLNLDTLDASLSEETLCLSISPERLFNLTYTSGSTGQPKGVLQTHQNILHNTREATHLLKFTREDRFALIMPVSFGASASDIFGALLNGAALCPFDLKRQGTRELAQWLRQEHITVYHSVPTVFRHLVGMLRDGETIPDMRVIELGGEPVLKHDIELFKQHFSDACILMNDLGTTETHLATWYLVDKATEPTGSIVPVGFPLSGRQVFVLDESGRAVSAGEIGQIAIKSRYLSPGYWRRPDLTAAAFLRDAEGGQQRIYLTGDLGRLGPDGCLEHLGRKDDLVKIRGQRVEVAEVEMALLDLDVIREAVVIAREGARGETCLVAYIVPEAQPAPATDALRNALAERLPDFMIPSAFVMMDRLPLLPFGKVDRRALPAPDWARSDLEGPCIPPRDDMELRLARIWEQALSIRPIGVTDNFFNLGGHSLLGAHLLAQIAQETGKSLPLAALFQAPTIEQLAKVLRQETLSATWSSLIAIQPLGSQPPFFCIPGMLGNVFTDLGDLARCLGPNQPFYGLQDSTQNPARIDALAAHYLDEIRTVQSNGPYLLGGICSGGIVAFEMARQLYAMGQPVALLALVETPYLWAPGLRAYLEFASFTFSRIVQRIGRRPRIATQPPIPHRGTTTDEDGRPTFPKARSLREGNFGSIPRQNNTAGRRDTIRLKIKLIVNDWALKRYAPQPYPGQVHILLTDESLNSPLNRFLRWRELAAGGAQIHTIPGRHDTIVGAKTRVDADQMSALAGRLRACIDDALNGNNS